MKILSLINRDPAESTPSSGGGSDHQTITTDSQVSTGTPGVTTSGQNYVQVNTPNPKLSGDPPPARKTGSLEQEVLSPKTNAPTIKLPDHVKGTEFSLEDPTGDKPSNDNKPVKTQVENQSKETTPDGVQPNEGSFEVEEASSKKPAATAETTNNNTIEGSRRGVVAGERDYSGFTPEIANALKRTNNETFATLSKTIREQQKQLSDSNKFREEVTKNGMPERWHEHPQAYVLHPEYQQLSALTNQVQIEYNFWKEQLVNIRSNKPWKTFDKFDMRTQQPIPGEESYKPDVEAEAYVLERMQIGQNKINEFQGGMQQIAGGFGKRMELVGTMFEKVVEKNFPWLKDAKDSRQQYVPAFMKSVPVEIADQYGTRLASYMFAQLQKANEIIRQQRTQIESGKFEKAEEQRLEPSIGTSPSINNNAPVKLRGGRVLPTSIPKEFDLVGME